MALVWQGVGIAALFLVVYLLHRRAKRTDFERFRAYHSRRKYRLVAEPIAPTADASGPPADRVDAKPLPRPNPDLVDGTSASRGHE